MASLDSGKDYVINYLKRNYPPGSTALDVGACDGKWFNLLGDYFTMDAVEIFEPSVKYHRLEEKYRKVFIGNITDYVYIRGDYDIAIFGDVVEHMPVQDAQRVLFLAQRRCKEVIVAVPYRWPQHAMYGNQWEKHIQDDLTHELFMERYHGFKLLYQVHNYGYYIKA